MVARPYPRLLEDTLLAFRLPAFEAKLRRRGPVVEVHTGLQAVSGFAEGGPEPLEVRPGHR